MVIVAFDEVLGIHSSAMVVNQLHESHAPTRRWVMSTATHVSPVSGVPARPAD